MNARRIRVMIVEDSTVVRALLEHIIGADGRFEIVASVCSAEAGLDKLETARPDVISLDIRLPGMNGFDFTRRVMQTCPTPIVVVSASVESEDLNIAMNALRAGALVVLEKPLSPSSESYRRLAGIICRQLALMSEVRVVRQLPAPAPHGAPQAVGWRPQGIARREYRVTGIVASTGGPNALVEVLTGLGADFPLPVLLVQHITPSFLGGFVTWLDRMLPQPVAQAAQGMEIRPGSVYVAPPEQHLEIGKGRIDLRSGGSEDFQRPSGNVLLRSLAREYGGRAIGIVLTGMGSDGAAGLKAIRDAGGLTVAEHASTCVVYGMPAAAHALGAVDTLTPLPHIAGLVKTAVDRRNNAGGGRT